jgi:hypothetical protein
MFLLGHDLFLAGQIEKIVTLAIVNPDCTVNLFLTKKQLNPSRFGSKYYKLIFLLLFIAEATSHTTWKPLRKIEPQLLVLLYIWQNHLKLNITF